MYIHTYMYGSPVGLCNVLPFRGVIVWAFRWPELSNLITARSLFCLQPSFYSRSIAVYRKGTHWDHEADTQVGFDDAGAV